MTIKKRLILGQIAMFVIPFLMIGVLVFGALIGLMQYARSGNHVAIESMRQFEFASSSVSYIVYHSIRHQDESFTWLVDLLNPVQNYIIVEEGDGLDSKTLYTYGNHQLGAMLNQIPNEKDKYSFTGEKNAQYIHVAHGAYYFMEKETIHGVPYYTFYVSQKLPHGTDESIENAFQGVMSFIGVILVGLVIGGAWIFSRFVVRHIMEPLEQLEKQSVQIAKGNLTGHVNYEGQDELTPVVESFNFMSHKLRESLERRVKEESAKKELIASLSHDIRTPLTAIQASVEALLDHVPDTEEKKERYLSIIKKRAGDLNKILDQLILLTGMDLMEEGEHTEIVYPAKEISSLLETHEQDWKEQGARFALSLDDSVAMAGNATLFQRILTNLINNSIKYKTEPYVNIDIRLTRYKNSLRLKVSDDGPGVAREDLGRITELFYRTDKARSHTDKGSGLGLAIVSRAVQIMQGTMHISLNDPHGLVFDITFPLKTLQGEDESHE